MHRATRRGMRHRIATAITDGVRATGACTAPQAGVCASRDLYKFKSEHREGPCTINRMSYRGLPRDEAGIFFRLPNNLPLVVRGSQIQDEDLESRVSRALLQEFKGNSSWEPKAAAVKECRESSRSWGWSGWWCPWWQSLRSYIAVVVSHAAAFSLGSYLAGAHHV